MTLHKAQKLTPGEVVFVKDLNLIRTSKVVMDTLFERHPVTSRKKRQDYEHLDQ